ncbi:MAG: sodium:proton antiporter [Candidatus Methylumidiphilus alinenensis]|uniref:Sodium:proton antiporter n=1 Tax=Candidatus Methylumidiphilus alinenensis TaxID=2202197 RepID=A0A2W4RAP1_9GAMM|nr:MAG: sodium:proton antiporter [Candidatus Methylumidiphilus alinenensis]
MEGGLLDTFTAIACLFGIAAILSFVNDRYLRLQHDIGLLLLAALTTGGLRVLELIIPSGAVGLLHQVTQSFNLNDTLLKGVLCFMLFRGSMRVSWATLREQRWLVLWLAFAGTGIACILTGGLVYAGLALSGVAATLAQALLFGALIAATDPVAALAILSKMGLPKKLETVVDGESLLNDGVAVVFFTIFAGAAISGSDASLAEAGSIFMREVLGGAAMGVAGWLVIHHLMLRSTTYCTGLLVSLGAVACLYAAAQHLDVSGPIATVVAGLLSGNLTATRLSEATLAPLRTFWSGLDEVLIALLFVFVGFHVVLINPLPGIVMGVPALVAIAAVLLARAVTVFGIVGGLNAAGVIRADCLGLTQLLTWGGLRGGLSLALAVSLPDSPWKPLMLNMTFAVVVFSVIVQGLTLQRMFTQERLAGLLR